MQNTKTSPLLLTRQYWPLFWTMFFGAFNDNVFKSALIIFITFKAVSLGPIPPEQMVALCGAIFILPFFLFSAFAGQISDRYSKSTLIRYIKIWEIFTMLIGSYAFSLENLPLLVSTLFMMGTQSAFFGPVKYSILPEIVHKDRLLKANALLEFGTFLAILFGTILGGVLFTLSTTSYAPIIIGIIGFAIIGTITSFFQPYLFSVNVKQKISFHPIRPTWEILKEASYNKEVFTSILGISWFWLIGAIFLSIIPPYAKDFLHQGEITVTILLATFSLGVGIGSIISEKMSHKFVDYGVILLGLLLMSFFILDLSLIRTLPESFIGVKSLFTTFTGIRIILDMFLFSLFGGVFIVPLYTLLQLKSPRESRSQMIAANNILNALFMVIGSIILMILLSLGLSIQSVLLFIFIINIIIYLKVYQYASLELLKLICAIVATIFYRVKINGKENLNTIKLNKKYIITSNHVGFVDWLFICKALPIAPRFVMHYSFFKWWFGRWFFKGAHVIPIAGMKENKKVLLESFQLMNTALNNNKSIVLFPEGEVTRDGDLTNFKPGIDRVLKEHPNATIIPLYLDGVWDTIFSRKPDRMKLKNLLKLKKKITITIFPLQTAATTCFDLEEVYKEKIISIKENKK